MDYTDQRRFYRKELNSEKNENDRFFRKRSFIGQSIYLSFNRRVYRTYISACTAINAFVRIDHINTITLGNCIHWAFRFACTAAYT